ncbi:MAG: hypothetical protein ACI80W_002019 [Porticoccaceae bacterium]|jgi:hypothetical protein
MFVGYRLTHRIFVYLDNLESTDALTLVEGRGVLIWTP